MRKATSILLGVVVIAGCVNAVPHKKYIRKFEANVTGATVSANICKLDENGALMRNPVTHAFILANNRTKLIGGMPASVTIELSPNKQGDIGLLSEHDAYSWATCFIAQKEGYMPEAAINVEAVDGYTTTYSFGFKPLP